jgi:hypothetical protein
MKNTNYIGVCDNLEESIRNYGFLCSNERSDEYYCIYKNSDSEGYGEAVITESSIHELLEGDICSKEEVADFLLANGNISLETFKTFSFPVKATDLMNYFGSDLVMGKCFDTLSMEEMLSMAKDNIIHHSFS